MQLLSPRWLEDDAVAETSESRQLRKDDGGSDQLSSYTFVKVLRKIRDGQVCVARLHQAQEVIVKKYFMNSMSKARLCEVSAISKPAPLNCQNDRATGAIKAHASREVIKGVHHCEFIRLGRALLLGTTHTSRAGRTSSTVKITLRC